jgi:PKD domain
LRTFVHLPVRPLVPMLSARQASRCALLSLIPLVVACSQAIEGGQPSDDSAAGNTTTNDPTEPAPTDPDGNDAPVADAGDDWVAMVTQEIELDGSGSYDPDGDEIEFAWSFVSAPVDSAATLINEDREFASFFADKVGVYVVEVVVRDPYSSASDEVQITVNEENDTPEADAGPDQLVDIGDTVVMNGSDSYDPEGDELTFSWTIGGAPGASTAFLQSPADVLTEFVPDVAGTYIIQLVVSDGYSTSAVDSAIVTASAAGGGGGGGGTTTTGGCLSCSAAEREFNRRFSANGIAIGLAPLGLVLLRRRRR